MGDDLNAKSIISETLEIIKYGYYYYENKKITFPNDNYRDVLVYSPDMLKNIDLPNNNTSICTVDVVNNDTYNAARKYIYPLVMNFANPRRPGGGFVLGSKAQEETLCRNSTLYASINSKKAMEMYLYNISNYDPLDSDYMLLSPSVWVFRDGNGNLIPKPFKTAVISAPAPNIYGGAKNIPTDVLNATIRHRIRNLFKVAAVNSFNTLILGAWGCGAFGNEPHNVAQCFCDVIFSEKYGQYFDKIVFSICGDKHNNYSIFKNIIETKQKSF